jgi:hypothetical protein
VSDDAVVGGSTR